MPPFALYRLLIYGLCVGTCVSTIQIKKENVSFFCVCIDIMNGDSDKPNTLQQHRTEAVEYPSQGDAAQLKQRKEQFRKRNTSPSSSFQIKTDGNVALSPQQVATLQVST